MSVRNEEVESTNIPTVLGTLERRRRASKGNGAARVTETRAKARSRQEHAVRINGARRQSVEAIIERGNYLNDAAKELAHGEYELMVREDLEDDPGTARKLRKIARSEPDRPNQLANRENFHALPARVSTLWELSFLTPESLLALVEDGTVHSKMTCEEAHALRSPPEPVPDRCAVCIDTDRVPEGHQWSGDDDQVEIDVEEQSESADLVDKLVAEIGRIFGPPRGSKPTLRQRIERLRDERLHPDIRAMLAHALREHAEISNRLADGLTPAAAPIQRRTRATDS